MACRTPRQVAESYLETPCEVKRLTRTTDGQGGSTESYATYAYTLCHAGSSSGYGEMETVVSDRLHGRTAYTVRLPFTTDVRMGDQLIIDGRTFDVVTDPARVPEGTATLVLAAEAE